MIAIKINSKRNRIDFFIDFSWIHKNVLLNFLISSILYAPPLKRGGLKCQKFLYFCDNKKSEECVKHANWALALTANIGDNKIRFEDNEFLNLLYNSCKKEKNMFIENLVLKLDLKSEEKTNKYGR